MGSVTLGVKAGKGAAKVVLEVKSGVDAGSKAGAAVSAFEAVSDAVVQNWSAWTDGTWTETAATAGASREVWGTVKVKKENGKYASIDIPCPIAGMVTANSVTLDTSNAALTAFVDGFKAATKMYISSGESVAATKNIVSGKIGKRSARYSHR